jgi:hypothetical protein
VDCRHGPATRRSPATQVAQVPPPPLGTSKLKEYVPACAGETAHAANHSIVPARPPTYCPASTNTKGLLDSLGSIEAVLSRKRRALPPVPPIFDGEKEAQLIALACSKPPNGHARWT